MQLSSLSFIHEGAMPDSCAFGKPSASERVAFSDNRNPHLRWHDVPPNTQSYALLCVDSDVPSRPDDLFRTDREVAADLLRTTFTHWVMVDIPPTVHEIAEGACAQGVVVGGRRKPQGPAGCRQGLNDYTAWFARDERMRGDYCGYDGPCPPWNDALVHRYHFRLFALRTPRLNVPDRFTAADALRAMQGHCLAETSIYATYTLNPRLRAARATP